VDDFLHRTTPFGAGENPTVEFEIKLGRFQTPPGSRMVVTFLCDQHTVVVDGFDNGVPFSGRPGDQLAIEGAQGCVGEDEEVREVLHVETEKGLGALCVPRLLDGAAVSAHRLFE